MHGTCIGMYLIPFHVIEGTSYLAWYRTKFLRQMNEISLTLHVLEVGIGPNIIFRHGFAQMLA